MTCCVAMHLAGGLVFASDSRTNAGIDHIVTFRKLFTFGTPGERLLVVQTADSLVTSQSATNLLQQRIRRDGASLLNVPSVYDATALIAETTRKVMARDGDNLAGNTDLSCSFLVGGQVAGGPPVPYSIYPQGNFTQVTSDTPFLQLGESEYGRPTLDRNLTSDAPLEQALRHALVSFDSIIHNSLSAGMPLGLLIYHRDSLILPEGYRVTEDDARFSAIRHQWSAGPYDLLERLPSPLSAYNT